MLSKRKEVSVFFSLLGFVCCCCCIVPWPHFHFQCWRGFTVTNLNFIQQSWLKCQMTLLFCNLLNFYQRMTGIYGRNHNKNSEENQRCPPLLASQTNGISRPESSEIRQVTQVFCRCLSTAFHIYKTVLNGVCITEQQLKHFFIILRPYLMRLCEN